MFGSSYGVYTETISYSATLLWLQPVAVEKFYVFISWCRDHLEDLGINGKISERILGK
jgi:hypothetical protein